MAQTITNFIPYSPDAIGYKARVLLADQTADVAAQDMGVDGLKFLHQRNDGTVHVPRLVRQFLDGFVIADARHLYLSWAAGKAACRRNRDEKSCTGR